MIKINIKKTTCLALVTIFLISTNAYAHKSFENDEIKTLASKSDDIDPLVDLEVTVTIKKIRALDKIDLIGGPDFYVKAYINDVEHISPVWRNKNYLTPNWSVTQDVPDDEENVNILIQLWDMDLGKDQLCDISPNDQIEPLSRDVELIYNLKTGHWTGDDYLSHNMLYNDPSGYGRLNGCDDFSIYKKDFDCELWFDITQNDYDNDGIPYWTEVNEFGTNPEIDNTGEDADDDGVPIEWEYKWGHFFRYNWHTREFENYWIYDPFVADDHAGLDPDNDGLDNVEEFLTSEWGSDPFRRDIFLELDQMEIGPNDEGVFVTELAKDLIKDAFSRQNIVFHIDDGCMGGGEIIPFDLNTSDEELQELYTSYFLYNDTSYWRRGAFHYGLVIYHCDRRPGFVFGTTANGEDYRIDSFQVSTKYHEAVPLKKNLLYGLLRRKTFNMETQRAMVYSGAIMHETGHTLGLFSNMVAGIDNVQSVFPYKDWWKFRNYKSCMSYDRIYYFIPDYSDGSHGRNDHDDWGSIDLTLFQRDNPWG